jgi:hypothetical protein
MQWNVLKRTWDRVQISHTEGKRLRQSAKKESDIWAKRDEDEVTKELRKLHNKPVARPLPTHMTTQTQDKRTHLSMP